jgi:ribulose-phosphate 3-epimerase
VTFHAEATDEPVALARRLREIGSRAGIAVKPGTALEPYLELLPEFDQILVMTVEPGFGGQSFMTDMMPKVAAARAAIDAAGIDVWVQVDGGIALDTIGQAAEAGADTFVAGSAVYGAADVEAAIADLRGAATRHPH